MIAWRRPELPATLEQSTWTESAMSRSTRVKTKLFFGIGMNAAAALLVLLFAASCDSPTITPEQTGCGTDENWRTFDDTEPNATVDDTQAPVLTQPSTDSTIPFAPKPVFAWKQSANTVGQPDGDVLHDGPSCNDCCPQYNTGALTTLHEPPISGDVYDLQFFDGGKLIYRVITTLQEWTAPDDTWSSWRGKTLTLKIYRAALLENDVKEGPFVASQPTTLQIGS
jgi:hypothetical protein